MKKVLPLSGANMTNPTTRQHVQGSGTETGLENWALKSESLSGYSFPRSQQVAWDVLQALEAPTASDVDTELEGHLRSLA